jgi:hypothetical protein
MKPEKELLKSWQRSVKNSFLSLVTIPKRIFFKKGATHVINLSKIKIKFILTPAVAVLMSFFLCKSR